MTNDSEAEKAIQALNGTLLEGRALNINEARPKPAGTRGRDLRKREHRVNRFSSLVSPARERQRKGRGLLPVGGLPRTGCAAAPAPAGNNPQLLMAVQGLEGPQIRPSTEAPRPPAKNSAVRAL